MPQPFWNWLGTEMARVNAHALNFTKALLHEHRCTHPATQALLQFQKIWSA